jgi:hypothetical protein
MSVRFSWKPKIFVLGAGLALAGAAVVWRARAGPPVPVYHGRPISEMLDWSNDLPPAYFELQDAVRALKGEAVPYLMHVLTNEPTGTQRVYANMFLRMPEGVQRRIRKPPGRYYYSVRRGTCAYMLAFTGSNGVAQIPFLARLSREDESHVREKAVIALGQLGPASEFESVALKALIEATGDTSTRSLVAKYGYGRLGGFSNRVAEVVPVLLKGLEDLFVRDACFYSLKVLGGTNEPLIKAAIDRGEADIFREHLESLQKRNAKLNE